MALLRAQGQVAEIGAGELAMDRHEAKALLEGVVVRLADADVDELVGRTEGWPVGLYLAALAQKAGGRRTAVRPAFTGDDRFMADYLRAELLTHPPQPRVAFLTRTAVLDRMSGPLCDVVLAERALRISREGSLDDYIHTALVHVVVARTALYRGDGPRAREHLAQAARLRPLLTYAIPSLAVQTLLELARAYLAVDDAAGARAVLRDARDILQLRPDLGILPEQVEQLGSKLVTIPGPTVGASSLTTRSQAIRRASELGLLLDQDPRHPMWVMRRGLRWVPMGWGPRTAGWAMRC
ncbi:MAG TPA: hypothetical protein VJ735_05200 [Actinomycetes bacterium]|nr:hypothetical protein [Actinomycetes bacterium]